jgi:hypothetical protein
MASKTAIPVRALTFLEALIFAALVAMFIWRWQAASPQSWVIFPVWLVASFAIHRDTPKSLGWRADNFWLATRRGLWVFAAFIATVCVAGLSLGALHHLPEHLFNYRRFVGYFAFCLLQQISVNSYLMNRFLFATSTPSAAPSADVAASSTGAPGSPFEAGSSISTRPTPLIEHPLLAATFSSLIFGALHWPNPVLVPVTLIGGFAMCLLFARHRNIIPLTLGQSILGGLVWWAFPIAWHHSMRVGPGYYNYAHRLLNL